MDIIIPHITNYLKISDNAKILAAYDWKYNFVLKASDGKFFTDKHVMHNNNGITKMWYYQGKSHREYDLPAVIFLKSKSYEWRKRGKSWRDNGESKPLHVSVKDKVLVFNKAKKQDDVEHIYVMEYKNGSYSVHNFKGNAFSRSDSWRDKESIDQFLNNLGEFHKSAFDSLHKNIIDINKYKRHKRSKMV